MQSTTTRSTAAALALLLIVAFVFFCGGTISKPLDAGPARTWFVNSSGSRCSGARPEDHEKFVSENKCGCNTAKLGFGADACHCPLEPPPSNCTRVALPDSLRAGVVLGLRAMKAIVSNSFYVRYPGWTDGSQWPPDSGCRAVTMVGQRRLDNIQWLLEDAIARGIPGGFIEAGAWKGGSCILAAAVFRAYGEAGRAVFVADSFKGIPAVNVTAFPKDAVHKGMDKLKILTDNSVALVAESFERLGLLGDPEYPVHFLEGWFKDSLPKADREGRFGSGFAIMRLDGDLYQSTWEGLKWLYPRLNPGGFVIVDDFYDWKGAHDAVLDFRQDHGLDTPLVPVYHDFGDAKDREQLRGVWFRKPD